MVFELFQKLNLQIYASQFMTSQIIQVWKGREKLQKYECFKNEKSFNKKIVFIYTF